jgi:hypothetical protein
MVGILSLREDMGLLDIDFNNKNFHQSCQIYDTYGGIEMASMSFSGAFLASKGVV